MLYQRENPHGGDVYGKRIRYDFSVSVNPLGAPRCVRRALRNSLSHLAQYPDPYCRDLISALSLREKVAPEEILCGNGASELIYAYCRAAHPKRTLIVRPAFAGYEAALRAVGCEVSGYTLKKETDFVLDDGLLECAEQTRPDAVFLCSPNNPTGRLIDPERLRAVLRFCGERGIRLFVDECFSDLADAGNALTPLLSENPHLFLLRSFTKSFALAGLRLGYGLCADKELLARAAETTGPWNVSVPAQMAGVAALRDEESLEKARTAIRRERARLYEALSQRCSYVCPSDANFLLFQEKPGLYEALLRRGILVRACGNFPGLDETWYRAAVLDRKANSALIHELRRFHEEG